MQSSLQERVEQAAKTALNRDGSVGPLELFQEMRLLQPVHVEGWRKGNELSKVAGLVFQMQGTLGVESNAAQPLYLNRPVTVGDVKAYVQAAPTGAAITFTIYVGGAAWLTLTIPVGQTVVVATPSQIGALTEIPANTAVSIGITAVGTTFPGSNLSVFIYS